MRHRTWVLASAAWTGLRRPGPRLWVGIVATAGLAQGWWLFWRPLRAHRSGWLVAIDWIGFGVLVAVALVAVGRYLSGRATVFGYMGVSGAVWLGVAVGHGLTSPSIGGVTAAALAVSGFVLVTYSLAGAWTTDRRYGLWLAASALALVALTAIGSWSELHVRRAQLAVVESDYRTVISEGAPTHGDVWWFEWRAETLSFAGIAYDPSRSLREQPFRSESIFFFDPVYADCRHLTDGFYWCVESS